MNCSEINIRDPYIVLKDGIYYMYGTRAANFGNRTGGFDVYTSTDLEIWSDPIPCFDSEKYGMNRAVNWAPEVHEYRGSYYMFATFTQESGLKGTCVLKSDSLLGPFVPHGDVLLTPAEWESLDGTLYVSPTGVPYLVFCHEHMQIIDGTVVYVQLSDDLTHTVGEMTVLFKASETGCCDPYPMKDVDHYVTDGPYMYRSACDELFMIWSSFIRGAYVELTVKFTDGDLGTDLVHMPPLYTRDGGHGMLFRTTDDRLFFTFHSPNASGQEHPCFLEIEDKGDRLEAQ